MTHLSGSKFKIGSNPPAVCRTNPNENDGRDLTLLGLDPSRLSRLDAHLAGYIAQGLLPGAVFLIERRGEVAHLSVQGFADLERRRPVTLETLFRLYSMTKPVTSVALMTLFEQGLFQLDDPISRFLPAFADMQVLHRDGSRTRATRPITIRDLCRHTSGLTYGFQYQTAVDALYRERGLDAPTESLAAWTDRLAELPLDFSPGEAWTYSVATDVVGRLIEVLAGEPFDQVLRTRLFEPLNMRDTDFFVPDDKIDRFAACYRREPAGGLTLVDDPLTSPFRQPPVFLSGGGGLVSAAQDYLAFARMLRNGGHLEGTRILSPATVALMSANHLPGGADLPALSRSLFSEAAYAGFGFGLGVSVTLDPALSGLPGNPGDIAWGGMANTYFWVDPKADLIAILMTQALPSTAYTLRRELRTLVYAAVTD